MTGQPLCIKPKITTLFHHLSTSLYLTKCLLVLNCKVYKTTTHERKICNTDFVINLCEDSRRSWYFCKHQSLCRLITIADCWNCSSVLFFQIWSSFVLLSYPSVCKYTQKNMCIEGDRSNFLSFPFEHLEKRLKRKKGEKEKEECQGQQFDGWGFEQCHPVECFSAHDGR